MQRNHIAIAAALALGTLASAAFAANGDAWYGSNRAERSVTEPSFGPLPPQPMNPPVAPLPGESVTVYYEDPAPAPVIVEREYVREPSYVIERDAPRENPLFHVDPQSRPTIDHGLFNRRGPNDFGS